MRLLSSHAAAIILFASLSSSVASRTPAKRSYTTHDYYVLEHDPSSRTTHHECIDAVGAELVEQVGELKDHWLIRVPKSTERDPVLDSYHSIKRRATNPQHSWWKRDNSHISARRISSGIRSLTPQIPRQRTKRWMEHHPSERQNPETGRIKHIQDTLGIHDPTFPSQWHLINEVTPPHDMNVSPLWEQGITGKGIISAIVDDGLDYQVEDLAPNYWAAGSWDFNDHIASPLPKLSDDQHGTRCAGEVAAARNDACGVGVAYDSRISGIRILSGPITDADEAASLNYGYNETSIYSCSWGPTDDGRSMEGPASIIQKAVINGIEKGRGGKGSIFVFASGNGGGSDDQCNFDGYTNSIYSVTVSAVDSKGGHPTYSEACAANMIVAYSSGSGSGIHTTDVKNRCTSGHGGTSAAAPLAVGVFALALQARPELTWRDIQHLCVNTAKHINPEDPDWEKTAQGRPYSYKYGFGALDAVLLTNAAKTWSLVKPQAWIEMPSIEFDNASMTQYGVMSGGRFIPPGGLESQMEITQELAKSNNFEKLEHITVKVWIDHSRRGDVEVSLVSPSGIKSVLGGRRRWDDAITGYPGWQFMTLKHWDENPIGKWTIKVSDQASDQFNGTFLGWSMTLWGSVIDPAKTQLYSEWSQKKEAQEKASASLSSVVATSSTVESPTSTKQFTKPTEHLPDDHDTAEGESHKPAFPGDNSSSSSSKAPAPSMTATPDEGIFPNMTDLLSSQTWFFVLLGGVLFLGAGAGFFLWRRRARRLARRGAAYATLSTGDDLPMGGLEGGASSRRAL
ncbi:pheromone processing endoprotease [Tulasnella sp. 418]|nr:pheromone processing endoprotease [Tulasnella sp. 418]